jgi:hypothetical protein
MTLKLQQELPGIAVIKDLRGIVNEIVAETITVRSHNNNTSAVVDISKVVGLIRRLFPDLCAIKVTWDERNNNGGMAFRVY